jgi:predicted aldo/keto reductase-like oxidoreductase
MMFTYNYRLMHRDRMRAAVDACAAAGIGLTAMKTQGGGSVKTDTDEEIRLAGHFVHRGFTDAQAKLKAVWEDARISSICSQMPSRTLLGTNAAAAMNRTKLAQGDRDALQRHAEVTRTAYCAGCGRLCSAALDRPAPVSEVMRCLMYHHSYGDRDRARAEFRRLGIERLAALDCRRAESLCPQHMPIARLMKEAAELFG